MCNLRILSKLSRFFFEFEFELNPAGLWLISGAFLIGNAKTDEADGTQRSKNVVLNKKGIQVDNTLYLR